MNVSFLQSPYLQVIEVAGKFSSVGGGIEAASVDHVCELALFFELRIEQGGVKRVVEKLVQVYFWKILAFAVECLGWVVSWIGYDPMRGSFQNFPNSSFMVFARIIVKRLKDHSKSAIIFQNFPNLYSLNQPDPLILQVKILVEVEWRIVDKVQPKIAGVIFAAELESMVAYQFVVDVYLDERGLVLRHQL